MKNLSQVQIREAAVDGERHYRKHLAALSRSMVMQCGSDIYAGNGSRLSNKGTLVSPELFSCLNGETLLKPLDESLVVAGAISLQGIINDLGKLLEEDKIFSKISIVKHAYKKHRADLTRIELPAQMFFKLTVLKFQLPRLYEHTLQVMLMGFYISSELKLDDRDRTSLLLAALFHDIGELYIDPRIINNKVKLNTGKRIQIYAHPVIAFMMLKEVGVFKADVARAVLEHHERLDGSGYPRGVKGENIGRLGGILGIAEFSIGVCDKYPDEEALIHLRILLSIHKHWFPVELTDAVTLFSREIAPSENRVIDKVDKDVLLGKLFTIDMVLHDWREQNEQISNRLLSNPERKLIQIMDERLFVLHKAFMRIGLQRDAIIEFVEMLLDDSASLIEVTIISQEVQFQLKSLMLEIRRHWPDNKFEESPYIYLSIWLDRIENTFFK